MSSGSQALPGWALRVLAAPGGRGTLRREGDFLLRADGLPTARVEGGVARFPPLGATDGTTHYRAIGGTRLHERRDVALSMSGLDSPIYHAHLSRLGGEPDGVVVDVGGGDGRNAGELLRLGHRRVVVVDAAGEALVRFRHRVAAELPGRLEDLLLIEADARALPLATGCARRVVAIEALYYLNEEHAVGLGEARRVMAPGGRLLLSERDYEGGLVMRAIHFGLDAMLRSAASGDLWEGEPGREVRTRSFTEAQLRQALAEAGLEVLSVEGTPLLSLLIGWLRGQGRLGEVGDATRAGVAELLGRLAAEGAMRRCHVAVAARPTTDRMDSARRPEWPPT